mmetsp:Transcript_55654/g.158044  ORF Transcript_55654/g.158044 Transcript_55654/m.158044 type:complete len:277 (-) Transcript_55654:2-832(-)
MSFLVASLICTSYSLRISASFFDLLQMSAQATKLVPSIALSLLADSPRSTAFDFSLASDCWPETSALACARARCVAMELAWLCSSGAMRASVSPSQASCSLARVLTSEPACATAIFMMYGSTPTFSALSRASSMVSLWPASSAFLNRVVVEAMKESWRKKCSNCSRLCCGILMTSASIILSSGSCCSLCSSSGVTFTPWASMSRTAADNEWQPLHCSESSRCSCLKCRCSRKVPTTTLTMPPRPPPAFFGSIVSSMARPAKRRAGRGGGRARGWAA